MSGPLIGLIGIATSNRMTCPLFVVHPGREVPRGSLCGRTKVSEGLSLAAGAKLAVAETYTATGAWPATNAAAGMPAANTIMSKYVTSVTVGANGVITILYSGLMGGNPTMNAQSVTLTPTDNGGSNSWVCAIAGDTTRYKYMPSECRN